MIVMLLATNTTFNRERVATMFDEFNLPFGYLPKKLASHSALVMAFKSSKVDVLVQAADQV